MGRWRVPPVAHYPGWIEQSPGRGAAIKLLAPFMKIFFWRIPDILPCAISLWCCIQRQETGGFFSTMVPTLPPLIWYHQSRHKLCDEKTSHHLINYLYSFFLKGPLARLPFSKLKGSMRKKRWNRNEMYFPETFFCPKINLITWVKIKK